MSTNEAVSRDLLREVIREVVREVIREVVAEEIAAAAASGISGGRASSSATRSIGSPVQTAAAARQRVSSAAMLQRGALTERHVRAAEPSSTITIGRAVVITPLAKERAKSMGIEIIRIEE